MSNRDVQPFQFACPSCEETIKFTYGVSDGALSGAVQVKGYDGIFDGSNPFVDLHLDFPVFFDEYVKGNTTFFKVIDAIGHEALVHLSTKLNALNDLYPKSIDLKRLITQFRRGDIVAFEKVCDQLLGIKLTSHKKEDVLAALYTATSIMSSPFTIHEHNKELSSEVPNLLSRLDRYHNEQFMNFIGEIDNSGFLRTLHFDCLTLYPKLLSFDLPLRPALYYDYADIDEKDKLPARVSNADFESCNNLYKDLSEVFSRQLVLIAGLNNLLKRGNANLFSDQKRFNKHQRPVKAFSSLNNYANVDLGQKLDAIDDSFFAFDHEAIDSQLRNGIAHFKYEYHESTQVITYYPFREGIERVKGVEIQFIEFMRKNLLLFREVHSINHIIKSLLYYIILVLKKDIQFQR